MQSWGINTPGTVLLPLFHTSHLALCLSHSTSDTYLFFHPLLPLLSSPIPLSLSDGWNH